MNSLTAEKRQQLTFLAAGTLCALGLIWFALVWTQQKALAAKQEAIKTAQSKIASARRQAGLKPKYEREETAAVARLQGLEAKMAAGDVYRWAIRALNGLQASNRVEINSIDPPAHDESRILPKVPYKVATLNINGSAYYHDFGKFLADLENTFPMVRLHKLELERSRLEAAYEEGEKLNFDLGLSVFVKAPPRP